MGFPVVPRVSASFTRPNDTNAYTAGDVVADATSGASVMQFSGMQTAGPYGAAGLIADAHLVDSANQATKGQFELWLFDAEPTTVDDNEAFAPTDAEVATLVGVVQLVAPFVGKADSGADGNCVFQALGVNLPFRCADGAATLYGILVARNAYTPVAQEAFTVILGMLEDK